jgi:hypothetical protein
MFDDGNGTMHVIARALGLQIHTFREQPEGLRLTPLQSAGSPEDRAVTSTATTRTSFRCGARTPRLLRRRDVERVAKGGALRLAAEDFGLSSSRRHECVTSRRCLGPADVRGH